jgi:hypothetical protein
MGPARLDRVHSQGSPVNRRPVRQPFVRETTPEQTIQIAGYRIVD